MRLFRGSASEGTLCTAGTCCDPLQAARTAMLVTSCPGMAVIKCCGELGLAESLEMGEMRRVCQQRECWTWTCAENWNVTEPEVPGPRVWHNPAPEHLVTLGSSSLWLEISKPQCRLLDTPLKCAAQNGLAASLRTSHCRISAEGRRKCRPVSSLFISNRC